MSDKSSKGGLTRAATVSSSAPLRHKDKLIPPAMRDRFHALDLDTLLAEYKEVASSLPAEEEDDDVDETPEETGASWLAGAGFGHLADKVAKGQEITDEDLDNETMGLTPTQISAIKSRTDTLNATLKRGTKNRKTRAQDVFPSASVAEPPTSPQDERVQKFQESSQAPTYFHDFSERDQQQIRQLNLIQLTTMLEAVGKPLPLVHSKASKRKKKKDTGLFGTTLSEMVEVDRKLHPTKMESPDVPVVLTRIINFLRKNCLNEEGLFRKAGSAARIKAWRQQCESFHGDVRFEKDGHAHDVSSLLKQLLRELPEPLLTSDFLEAFSVSQYLRQQQLYGLQLLVMLLPRVHQACLRLLLKFLWEVSEHAESNKMSLMNIAVVFAPTLFFMRGKKGQVMLSEIEMQVNSAQTLKTMIEHQEALWRVPPDILAQVRYVNASRHKGRKVDNMKNLKRIVSEHKMRPQNLPVAGGSAADSPEGSSIEWVKGSTDNPPIIALVDVMLSNGETRSKIPVTLQTRAQDVLTMTKAPPNDHLFEFGGNITYRRLSNTALLFPIFKVNPGLSLRIMSST